MEVSPSRDYSEHKGYKPIKYSELKNYMELTQTFLEPREVRVLKKLDFLYLEVMNG